MSLRLVPWLLSLVDGRAEYILGLVHMVFSSSCSTAMNFVYIVRVEAILPMNVDRLRIPCVGIVQETGWFVRFVHQSGDNRPCLCSA
jgi:hypothetical protein